MSTPAARVPFVKPEPIASVVIVTKNRRHELRRAIESALSQAAPIEVIVIDDGSSDGTGQMVRADYPAVALVQHQESRGYIVRRNEGAHIASTAFVFSIDDDAAFSTPHTVWQTVHEFQAESIGAVAIPYIDVNRDRRVRQIAADSDSVHVTDAFIGTAHAVRRELFLRLGGYREHFVHQGEEGDFCVRMLDAGYFVRLGTADPIHHFESPKRDLSRMDFFGVRNAVVFAWQNVPFPFVLAHLPVTSFRCLTFTFEPRRFWIRFLGLLHGYRCLRSLSREPVSPSTYRLARRLRKIGSQQLTRVEPEPERLGDDARTYGISPPTV